MILHSQRLLMISQTLKQEIDNELELRMESEFTSYRNAKKRKYRTDLPDSDMIEKMNLERNLKSNMNLKTVGHRKTW